VANTAVICLGNRFIAGDALGCRVYDYLTRISPRAAGIDILDGGLCGLDLLRLVEHRQRVVFVDAVAGLAESGATVVLSRAQIAAHAGGYGHGAGLPYLLQLLPALHPLPLPEIVLVGSEGEPDAPMIRQVAELSMEIAVHGTC